MTTLAPTGQGWSTTSCSSLASTEWSGQHAVPISTRLRTSRMSWISKSGATTPLPGMLNICSRCCRLSGRRFHRGSSPTWSARWGLAASSARTAMVVTRITELWEHPNTLFCDFNNFGKSNFDTYPLGSNVHTKQLLEIEWNCASLSLKHKIKCLPNFNALAFFFGKLWIYVQVILNFLCVVYVCSRSENCSKNIAVVNLFFGLLGGR